MSRDGTKIENKLSRSLPRKCKFILLIFFVLLQIYVTLTVLHHATEPKLNTGDVSKSKRTSNGDQNVVKTVSLIFPGNETMTKYTPKCETSSPEAKSAIARAVSEQCKQHIADIACQHQSNYIFAKYIARTCPLREEFTADYVGCFQDTRDKRRLDGAMIVFQDNYLEKCVEYCLKLGMVYAGLQFRVECWCGNRLNSSEVLADDKQFCNMPCPGKALHFCGGSLTLSVYTTGFQNMPGSQIVQSVSSSNARVKVKVVFILTLKGRSVRQVKQLFRLIFRPQHYYCVHIDQSAEYMYRELSAALKQFTNVKIMENRLDTIWMGPNLLTAILNSFHAIYNWPDIKWDYVVNLGEKDFPLRSVDELTSFLTSNNGTNFVNFGNIKMKSLGDEKLMNGMFVECDNYIWHIGKRMFPNGLYVTGNSDRFCLHHNFVEYILQSTDELVKELKKYYTYSIMASQSFFSMVLVNGGFCKTAVAQNLHLSYYDEPRTRHCNCNFSDWCACSPSTYQEDDYTYLMRERGENPMKYFARQLNGMTGQRLITWLEHQVLPAKIHSLPSADNFWFNQLHHEDAQHDGHDSAFYTYYHSFIRRSLQKEVTGNKCYFTFKQILEANIFVNKDNLKQVLLKFNVSQKGSEKEVYTLETLVQSSKHMKIYNLTDQVLNFHRCEIGSTWDEIEQTFQNHGSFLGPESSISLAIFWVNKTNKMDFTINIVYIDPAMTIAGNFKLNIAKKDLISLHTPHFNGPLRPGIWNVQLLFNKQLFVQYSFVIIPGTHNGLSSDSQLSDSERFRIHSGPSQGVYSHQNQSHINLENIDTSNAKKAAEENSQKSGSDLEKWVDKLSSISHEIKDICVNTVDSPKGCSAKLRRCDKCLWSSSFPDPKTDLDSIHR